MKTSTAPACAFSKALARLPPDPTLTVRPYLVVTSGGHAERKASTVQVKAQDMVTAL